MAKVSFTAGRVQDFKCPSGKQQAIKKILYVLKSHPKVASAQKGLGYRRSGS
jgi:hypothetical protein